MLSFLEYLSEHVLSIGINPKHEKYREKYRHEIHNLLHNSYKKIGGYSGLESGSKAESDAIHDDISNHDIKAIRRDGKITAATIYKKQHGRKMIAMGTNASEQGKADVKHTAYEDNKKKRSWAEVSGAPEAIYRKQGHPVIPAERAAALLGKQTKVIDAEKYERNIGGHSHVKTIMGHPKKENP